MPEYEYTGRTVSKSDASVKDHTTFGYTNTKTGETVKPVTTKIIVMPDGTFLRPYGQTADEFTFFERKLITQVKPEK